MRWTIGLHPMGKLGLGWKYVDQQRHPMRGLARAGGLGLHRS